MWPKAVHAWFKIIHLMVRNCQILDEKDGIEETAYLPVQCHGNHLEDRMDTARSWSSHFVLVELDPTILCLACDAQ